MTDTVQPVSPADQMLDKAEAAGKLKPVEDALKAEGADLTARDFLKYAQFDDRTKGLTPDSLAKMIADDPSIIQDIINEKEKHEGADTGDEGEPPNAADTNPEMMMQSRLAKAKADEVPTE